MLGVDTLDAFSLLRGVGTLVDVAETRSGFTSAHALLARGLLIEDKEKGGKASPADSAERNGDGTKGGLDKPGEVKRRSGDCGLPSSGDCNLKGGGKKAGFSSSPSKDGRAFRESGEAKSNGELGKAGKLNGDASGVERRRGYK